MALRARAFATRGLRDRKALSKPVGFKTGFFLPTRSEGKKSYVRFKIGTQNRQCGKRGHGPDRSQMGRGVWFSAENFSTLLKTRPHLSLAL